MSNRNILNQGTKISNNIYVNTVTADLPLQITENGSTATSINLGGLNSFGTTKQILQVNPTGDGLEYSATFTGDITTTSNTSALRYVKAVSPNVINRLELNNSGPSDRLLIYNLENQYSRQNRLIIDNATDDQIKVGNSTDTLQLINAGATLTLPTSTTTLVGTNTSDTLTNKTLTSPIISAISNAGQIITLPTSTTTLVGTNTPDTLTNKTLTDPKTESIKTLAGNNLLGVNQFSGLSLGNTTDNTSIFSLQSLQNTSDRDIFTYISNTLTFNNQNDALVMNGSGITGSLILDEDDMASDSSTKLATQQSIKAYVNSKTLFQNSASGIASVENIDKSTPRYVKLARNTEADDCGFWIQTVDGGTTKNAYMFLYQSKLNFQNDFNNKFRFYSSSGSADIENPSGGNMLSYSGSALTIGNSSDTVSIINSTGTLTLPTNNDTLVGRLTTDTLENKTLKNPILFSSATQPGLLNNTGNRAILKYTQGNYFSFNTLELNNNATGLPDILNIYGLSRLMSRQDKEVFLNTTDNELEFGNAFDLVKFNHNGFQLKDANGNITLSNKLNSATSRYNTVIGTGADTDENVALTIRNKSGASPGDCRLRLRNTDTTSSGSNAVIEFLQNTGSSYEGSYIFQSATTYDLLIQSSKNIGFYDNNAITAFFANKSLLFQNAASDIRGNISASTHPHNTTSRMRNIYCNEVVCVSPISENDTVSYKGFDSKYPLTSIRGLNETGFGPGDSRNAMLKLGTEQQTTANDNIYPIMRINSPAYADSEFYNYIQSNSDLNDYYGWAYSYSGSLYYFLEFNSNYQVISYQDLICTQDVAITGNLSKGTGTFKIKHPIEAEAEKGKHLIHSFVEAPRCDNIYSGKVQLQDGKATVDLDDNDWYQMTRGTFNKLNKDPRVYLSNNENFDRVIGKINGNQLNILCENPSSSAVIDWQVIGTRQDDQVKQSNITDDNGDLITEIIEQQKDRDEKVTKKTTQEKRQDKVDRINHSRFKSLGKKFQRKTKKDSALYTARRLVQKGMKKSSSLKSQDFNKDVQETLRR